MSLLKKAMLAVVTFVLALVAFVAPANNTKVEAAVAEQLLFTPGSIHQGNERYAAYFFGNGEKWVSMTDSNGDKTYEVTVPAGFPNVIFCRMNGSNQINSWNNKWDQTSDLVIPTDGTNLYIATGSSSGKILGSWKVLEYGKLVMSIIGSYDGHNWDYDTDLVYNKDAKRYEATVKFAANDEWKVRYDHAWSSSFGGYHSNIDASVKSYCKTGADNLKVTVAGEYVVWVDNDGKLGMDPVVAPWELEVRVGYQVGTKDEAKALRLVAELNLTAELLETFESTVAFRVTKGEIADERVVKTLYSSVNPMNGEAKFEGAYYAVLTYVNIPAGEYLVEVLVDGVVAATATATVA